ncbi:DUF4349 domain-containing protein [Desulfofundulus thermobenzoicus]|uniref:Anti-sigma-W factor RsiW n=1 Tax=Desulfofundulus thermobenzoicus TaxID=29376 RepID=A0A6N7ITW0_9FIRM|nr:zf-HC2 domain-containing protein [Desulfofundulus thermobenzoicus]MQL52538.1 DUF4349 domain-containing protein [Desulfofundulus thermobenzoicus]
MRCQQIQELLSTYLDGELEPSRLSQIEAHLCRCPACRNQWEDLKAAMDMLRDLPDIAPPANFSEQLKQKLKRRNLFSPSRTARWFGRGGIFAVAAVLAVALGLTSLWACFIQPEIFMSWKDKQHSPPQMAGNYQQKGDNVANTTIHDNWPGLQLRSAPEGTGAPDNGVGKQEGDVQQKKHRSPQSAGGNSQNRYTAPSGGGDKNKTGTGGVAQPQPSPEPGLMAYSSSPAVPEAPDYGAGVSRSGKNGELRPPAADEKVNDGQSYAKKEMPGRSINEIKSSDVKIIKEIALTIQVPDVNRARAELVRLASRYNALVEPEGPGETGKNRVVFLVPDNQWPAMLHDMGGLGQMGVPETRSRDVTLEYDNLSKSLSLLREKEEGLLTTNGDSQKRQLQQLQEEIVKTEGKLHALTEAVRRTTVQIVLKTG